jgi:O-antigen/teichoic acid export membrane protein
MILIARAGWPLRLGWDRAALADLLGLGAGLTLKRVINYAAANVDYAVIGRRLGPADLGYYTRAYGLITMPLHQFSRVIMSVLFPAFSRIQGDDTRLIAGYSKVVTATAIASFPFLAGLALVAPSFINVVYGEKWLPTVLPLTIMCVAGMMKSVSTFVGAIADAKGQVKREVKRQLIYLAVLVAGTIAGSRYGTAGVAVAVVFASFLMLLMMQSFLGSLTGMRWRTYLGALWPAVAATLVMAAAVVAAQAGMGRFVERTSVAMLVVSTAVGMVIYPLALLGGRFPAVVALRRELERDLAEVRRRRQGSPRPPSAVDSSPTCQESLP